MPNAKELNKYLFKDPNKVAKQKNSNSGFGWHSKTDMDKRRDTNL